MLIEVQGSLRHYFHGEYSAGVGLLFDSEFEAGEGLKALGEGWVVGKDPSVLVWFGGSEALDALKLKLSKFKLTVKCGHRHCASQCKNAAIDSVNHSIDSGPPFRLTLDVPDPRQISLF